MRIRHLLLALCLCTFAAPAFAQTTGTALDINLNNDAVRLGFSWRLGDPKYLAAVGWLHNQDRGDVIHGSFHLVDAASSAGSALQAGLGVRLVHTLPDPDVFDGTALALGGFARYTLPNANRYSIAAYGYFAPEITSFGDQTEYYELGVRAGYSVLRDGDVYLGLRRVRAEYNGISNFKFDSGLHVGFEIRFQ